MHGWMGSILLIDLTHPKATRIATQPYADQYLGGRGIASRLYWEKVTPEVKALAPENRLIFMTGPLVATGAQGAARMAVAGKSPMASPEGYCYGSMGGYFGAELKKAGLDGVVLDGKAPRPMYLSITDDDIQFLDASSILGKGTLQIEKMLAQIHGDKARFVTTGPAADNLVRSAIIYGSHRSTCTGGFGAVMASKNLKAIVVKGSQKPSAADPERLTELNRYISRISKRLSLAVPPSIGASRHGHVLEVVGKKGCYQCGLTCTRHIYRYGKDPELVGDRRCQSMEFYLPWSYGRDEEPLKTLFDAPTLANDYGVGTFELQSIINWLYACQKAGVLTEAQTGLPLSIIGTRRFLETLLFKIAHRQDFGAVLAEGLVRAGQQAPQPARALLQRSVAPIGQHDLVPPRAFKAHALIYPFETRMHPLSLHEMAFAILGWRVHQRDPELSPVSPELFCKIAKAFWGSEAAADVSGYEGQALAARNIANRTYLKDSLGLCDFVYPLTYSLATPDHMGDPTLEAGLTAAVTGIAADELGIFAERLFTLQRVIQMREGHRIPEDDFPPTFNFTDPLQTNARGEPVMVPGPGGQPCDAAGNLLDREKYIALLKDYYTLRGWDRATGLPLAQTVADLGLNDLPIRHHPRQPEGEPREKNPSKQKNHDGKGPHPL